MMLAEIVHTMGGDMTPHVLSLQIFGKSKEHHVRMISI
jgi:hypothetical protein